MRRRRIIIAVAFIPLVLLFGCRSHPQPKNLTPVGTVCADVAVNDYNWTYTWGYDPATGKFGWHYTYTQTGSHIENWCDTVYITPDVREGR